MKRAATLIAAAIFLAAAPTQAQTVASLQAQITALNTALAALIKKVNTQTIWIRAADAKIKEQQEAISNGAYALQYLNDGMLATPPVIIKIETTTKNPLDPTKEPTELPPTP